MSRDGSSEARPGLVGLTKRKELFAGPVPTLGEGAMEFAASHFWPRCDDPFVDHFEHLRPLPVPVEVALAQIALFTTCFRSSPVKVDRGAREMNPSPIQGEFCEEDGVFGAVDVSRPLSGSAHRFRPHQRARSETRAELKEPGNGIADETATIVSVEQTPIDVEIPPVGNRDNRGGIRLQRPCTPFEEIAGPMIVGIEERDERKIGHEVEADVSRMRGRAMGFANDLPWKRKVLGVEPRGGSVYGAVR